MDCSCSTGDYDPPAIFSSKEVKARKSHVCCECGGEIKKGDYYEKVKGLWEGEWREFKTCFTCLDVREVYFPCDEFCIGEMYYEIGECMSMTRQELLGKKEGER